MSSKKYNDLESSYKKILREKEDGDKDIAALHQKVAKLESELTEVNRTKNALEGDSMWKIKRIEELEKELNDLDIVNSDEAFGWKNRITQLQQELDAAKNKISRLESTNQTYAQKVKDFSKDLIKAMQKVAQLECKSDEDQEKINEQRRESMEAYKKAADFEAATNVCNSTKNELNSVIQSLQD